MSSEYRSTYEAWARDPEGFWSGPVQAIDWFTEPRVMFDPQAGVYGRWFPDGVCNTCFNALDRHVAAGRAGQAAIIHESPVTGMRSCTTYGELLTQVKALAATLADLGVEKGDRVIIYMPMVLEAAVAMLACARLGAVHSVVFGGFAAVELAARIDDATPRLILSASCGIEPTRVVAYKPLLDTAIDLAVHKPVATIILQRPQLVAAMTAGRDHDWGELRVRALAEVEAGREMRCVPVQATDPLYILYTSGTTGQPKGVVRDNGGHMVAVKWSLEAVYGVRPGEVFWACSDVGWVVGHSYIVYGPLLHGATGLLFEGKPVGTPDASTFWRVIAENRVVSMFAAPTAIRAIRKEDPGGLLPGRYDLSAFRTLFLAGERVDTETILWAERALGVPVIDHWWQTETGWPMAANQAGFGLMPVKHGSPGLPVPGYRLRILDEAGQRVAPGSIGAIAVELPLPPGAMPTLWKGDRRFREAYLSQFPGYYATADGGMLDEDGYLHVFGRTDDVINVAGHRLSTGEMEEAVATHPDVAECAVIGMRDDVKGEVPCGFVVLTDACNRPLEAVRLEVIEIVRDRIGPVAAFRRVVVVDRLPKTRSGKILRGSIKKIADREPFDTPATIEDASVLDHIRDALDELWLENAAAI